MSHVCVAISVRNGEAFLEEAIVSVLGQTHEHLELRIYDNLSTDGSGRIARSAAAADARVSSTANGRDLGYYGSLNRALAETTCELFVPFAADDVMEPENLARKVDAVERTGAGFAYSPVTLIDRAGTVVGDLGWIADAAPHLPAPEFLTRCVPVNCVTCPSVVVRTQALRDLGGFDGRVPYCADWLAWMRLAMRHGVAFVAEQLVRWRQHPESGTSDSLRSAVYATEDPAALRLALDDEAMPPGWDGRRGRWLAACLARTAGLLERDRHLRAARGPAAYGLALRALELAPADPALPDLLARLVRAADLAGPALPVHAVLAAGMDAGLLAEGIEAARRLEAGGPLASLAVCVPGEDVDRAVAVLEPLLEGGPDVGVDLVPGASPTELLLPGSIAFVPWRSRAAALAESHRVPVRALGAPNPFDRPADPDRFETLAAA